MLIFIDESGGPGFKLKKGSSPFFTIAMVVFTDYSIAEKTSKHIEGLRKRLKIKPEFKFNKSHPNFRDVFFEELNQFDFQIKALVVDKVKVYSPNLRNNKENFYHYFLQTLLKNDEGNLKNASVKLDGYGDKEARRKLSKYLKSEMSTGRIAKFRFLDSKKDNLIQLADMSVGAIARSYNGVRKDSKRWLNMLDKKIDKIWEFK